MTWSRRSCAVCEGSGLYPVIDRHGQTLYAIICPDCSGIPPEADAPPASAPDPSQIALAFMDAPLPAPGNLP